MVARMVTPALVGLDTATVQVEVDLRGGLPAFLVVGLPDAAGRMDLVVPLSGSAALRGTQLHLQGAFRSGGGIALTRNLVSPVLLD